ncbi:MAG: recombinase family protein, partial [Candidatus Thermoplasmatota archaeon]|nr:recombinase family protein [Candidatus Thermoplasmatota archaeon]
MRVAIYTRCSTEAQAKARSTELQLEQIERYCKFAKHKVAAHYNDEAKSGADINSRPEFQRLMKDAERHR